MTSPQLFLDVEVPQAQRRAACERLAERFPDSFVSTEQALTFLRSIHMPASLRWAFLNNGKTGTSSARRFLFQLEFGVPLSVNWNVPHDINPDGVVHNLQGPAGLFRPVLSLQRPLEKLSNSLRLVTVRHPISRAVSSFEYLCKSHDLAHTWFVQDRLRMNAVVKFDWAVDCRTAGGFAKFLDYLVWSTEHLDRAEINSHWRTQIDTIQPEVFRPDLIGRVEDMPAFYRSVATRLSVKLPEDFDLPASNRQSYTPRHDWLTASAMRLLRDHYSRDFAWLGYDLEGTP